MYGFTMVTQAQARFAVLGRSFSFWERAAELFSVGDRVGSDEASARNDEDQKKGKDEAKPKAK